MGKGRSDGEETKRRIVDKAKQLFVQRGYGAVTMNEVCEAAGVSKGSLYHHFPSKDELFLHIVEEDTKLWRSDRCAYTVSHHLVSLGQSGGS